MSPETPQRKHCASLPFRLYIVDGTDVHITRDDGQTAIIQLTERDDKDGCLAVCLMLVVSSTCLNATPRICFQVWLQDRWYIDLGPNAKLARLLQPFIA